MKQLPKSQAETKPEYWSKMPLSAPLYIRCPKKLFIYGIILFKIGNQKTWSGNLSKIVEIANENTPLNQPRWTYAKVDYILRWLRKEGWIHAERPARNKPLVYSIGKPTGILPMTEPAHEVQIQKAEPVIHKPVTLYNTQNDEEANKRLEEFYATIGS